MMSGVLAKLTILSLESSKGFGGQERRLLHEALWLRRAGHEVIIACPSESPLYLQASAAGGTVYGVSMRNSVEPASLFALVRIIRRHRVDVLYSHSGKDSWLGGLSGWIAGVPLVRSRELLNPVKHRFAYNLLPKRVLACSAAVKEHLVASGVDARKVFVQYPPVATTRYSSVTAAEVECWRQRLELTGHFPVISCVAGMRGEKRQIDLIRAMQPLSAEFPEVLLLLLGSGHERAALERIAAETGVADRVRFLGEVEEVPAVLANSDVFVLPSSREPFGMAPVEAMAAGVPVVVTRTGGLAEIVSDGVNGLHVPVEEPQAISRAVARICREQGLSERLSAGGRRRAEDFSEDVVMEKLVGHFRAVASKR